MICVAAQFHQVSYTLVCRQILVLAWNTSRRDTESAAQLADPKSVKYDLVMEIRHEILIHDIFLPHKSFSYCQCSYKSETSDQNKEVRQEYLPSGYIPSALFSDSCAQTPVQPPSNVFVLRNEHCRLRR